MKFSELWLREWVDITLDSKALLNQITMAGLEVNSVEPVAGKFHGVIIGEIIEYAQHPNTEKLLVTKVNIGDERLLHIICDIFSCRKGLKVAVAKIGSVLPKNSKIKLGAEFFGQLSQGILCSYSELGISCDHNGIIELPADAPIGTDIRDYLKLDDNTIEITVTPNRGDCLGIIGVAREIAVLNKSELKIPNISSVETTISDTLPTQIEDDNACPRYLGRVVKGINIKIPAPLWIKEKLRRCGTRSLNSVIDIINYVMLELGQPIHIFDEDKISGGIIVRMAKYGEKIALLDNTKVELHPDTIVIADSVKILAIGGIVGGKHSSINNQTKNLLIVSAFFNPYSISRQARRHGLHTDISHRNERGIDPDLQYKAIERITHLLIEICGGEAGPIINITNEATLPKGTVINLRRSQLDRLIGNHIDDILVSDILQRLGCKITEYQNQWHVITPSWRFNIKIEEDLIEEVARIYGYNNIPNKPVQANLIMHSHCEAELSLKRVKILLNDKGYHEVITYSFVNPKLQQLIHPGKEALILSNPISIEMSAMRLSLWPGLLQTIIYNQNRQENRIRIFEAGLCFSPDIHASLGVCQELMLAGAICGNRYQEHWDLVKNNVDFYDIKGDLESIFELTGKLSKIEFRAEIIPALHPGQSAAIYIKNKRIGFIGAVHPELEHKLNLNNHTMIFQVEWSKIAERIVPKAQDISRFPYNRRDISIVVAENIPVADILIACKKSALNRVVSVNLFDIYRGNGIAKGFKSLAISLIFQDSNHTLKEREITATLDRCLKTLKKQFHASLRNYIKPV